MKTLIVYYTRTGTTKIAADALAKELSADVEEIKDSVDYSGVFGYMKAGRDALRKKESVIQEHKYDPAKYELVVIGTPVWAGLCAPAVRAYIKNHKQFFKNAAAFTTQGGAKRQGVFDEIKEQLGRELLAELYLTTKEVRAGNFGEKLKKFIQ